MRMTPDEALYEASRVLDCLDHGMTDIGCISQRMCRDGEVRSWFSHRIASSLLLDGLCIDDFDGEQE